MLTNTLVITALILLIILAVPLLCKRIHIPAIVGLILTGILIGPYGFGLVARTATLSVFGQLGILYIMFLSGIEIDIDGLKSRKGRSILFGALTFFLPLAAGFAGGLWLGMTPWSALLVASILGSHTLMTYPVVSRFGIQKNEAVNLVIGATVFAVTAAMLILAGVSSLFHEAINTTYWLRLGMGSLLMVGAIFYLMPRLARWFLRRYNDSVVEFVFIMALALSGGLLAQLAGLEPILGVFLSALALNRQIPNLSPLMNRIHFVGNGIFIPVFLVSVGMLIDLRVLAYGYGTMKMIAMMVLVGVFTKWLAAFFTQRLLHLSRAQRQLLFGLTNAHAAGALATVMVGYAIVLPDGTHLIEEQVLNGTVILILVACAISSFITEHAAKRLSQEVLPDEHLTADEMQLLMPLSNPTSTRRLVELSTILISRHPESALHATSVTTSPAQKGTAERLLEDAARQCASTDHALLLHRQMAANVANGIRNVATTRSISHIVMGLPSGSADSPAHNASTSSTSSHALITSSAYSHSSGLGIITSSLVPFTGQQIWLYHAVQSLHDIRQVRVLVPTFASSEPDYTGWQILVERLVQTLGVEVTQETVTDWTFLPRAAKRMDKSELYIIVQARHSTPSYSTDMDHVPEMMRRHFSHRDYIILYPAQHVEGETDNALLSETIHSGDSTYSFIQRLVQKKK